MMQSVLKNDFKHYYTFLKDSTISTFVLKLFSDYTYRYALLLMIAQHLTYISVASFLARPSHGHFFLYTFFSIRNEYSYLRPIVCKSPYVKLQNRKILCRHSECDQQLAQSLFGTLHQWKANQNQFDQLMQMILSTDQRQKQPPEVFYKKGCS